MIGLLIPIYLTTISSEERASEWAEESGLQMVFGNAVARRWVGRGVAQLAAVWKKYQEQYEVGMFGRADIQRLYIFLSVYDLKEIEMGMLFNTPGTTRIVSLLNDTLERISSLAS
jgi:hypothetical protein